MLTILKCQLVLNVFVDAFRKNIRRVMLGQSFFDLLRNEEEIAVSFQYSDPVFANLGF